MVLTCCIKNCKEQQKQGTNVSFHRFPKNAELKKQWIKAIKYDNFEPLPHSRICSKHFANDCFVQTSWSSKRTLNADAVPNVSDIPEREHMQETDVLNIPCIKTENEVASSKNDCEDDNLIHAISSDKENVSHEMSMKKKRKVYIGDFKECDMTSEKENYIEVVNKVVAKKNKQIKILQQKNKRLLNKIQDLHSLVDELRNINMINEETSITLLDNLPTSSKTLFKQMMRSPPKICPVELKNFALTLNFYSPGAYNYVRKTMNNVLPHPRTLQKWYSSVACEPGFHSESLNTLKIKVSECKDKGKACICALIIDEMSIHRKVEWNGEKFVGYVDVGKQTDDESVLPEEKEAIVCLIVRNPITDSFTTEQFVRHFTARDTKCFLRINMVTFRSKAPS